MMLMFNSIVDDLDFITPTDSSERLIRSFLCKLLILELNKLVSYYLILMFINKFVMYVTYSHTYFLWSLYMWFLCMYLGSLRIVGHFLCERSIHTAWKCVHFQVCSPFSYSFTQWNRSFIAVFSYRADIWMAISGLENQCWVFIIVLWRFLKNVKK